MNRLRGLLTAHAHEDPIVASTTLAKFALLEVEGRLSESVWISNIMNGVDDVKSVGAGSVDVLPTCGR